jgi:ketosteroid isomerase-like protein
MHVRRNITIALVALSAVMSRAATAQSRSAAAIADSAAIVATVARFHSLLAAGDSAGAARLLAPDLMVLESGEIETRAQYLAQHIGADIEYARAVPAERQVIAVNRQGDVAWLVASSAARGTFRNRPIDSRGAELMVLSRGQSGWLIRAIHWSSQRRRTSG